MIISDRNGRYQSFILQPESVSGIQVRNLVDEIDALIVFVVIEVLVMLRQIAFVFPGSQDLSKIKPFWNEEFDQFMMKTLKIN